MRISIEINQGNFTFSINDIILFKVHKDITSEKKKELQTKLLCLMEELYEES